MSEQDNTKEAQKTVIAFIAGLLIGGLLVWVFSEPSPDAAPENENDTVSEVDDMDDDEADDIDTETGDDAADDDNQAPEMQTGDGSIDVRDQAAGSTVSIDGAVFPEDEGWIAVRDYANGEVGRVLGATRFSRSQGLMPESVRLLRPTVAGNEYAVVFFTESGDRSFNMATDTQIEGVMTVFEAQ